MYKKVLTGKSNNYLLLHIDQQSANDCSSSSTHNRCVKTNVTVTQHCNIFHDKTLVLRNINALPYIY